MMKIEKKKTIQPDPKKKTHLIKRKKKLKLLPKKLQIFKRFLIFLQCTTP